MIKINFIEILVFTLLILLKFAHCNTNIEAPEHDSELSEMLHKQGGVWFGPRLEKRTEKGSVDSVAARNNLVTDEVIVLPLDKLTFDAIQNSPNIIYLLAAKQQTRTNKNRYLTPRLGRDTDDMAEFQPAHHLFARRLGSKNIPFSPRLGRQLFER